MRFLILLAAVVTVGLGTYFDQQKTYDQSPGSQFMANLATIRAEFVHYDLTDMMEPITVQYGTAQHISVTGKSAFDTSGAAMQLTQGNLNAKRKQLQQKINNFGATFNSRGFQHVKKREAPPAPEFDFGDYKLVFFVQDVTL